MEPASYGNHPTFIHSLFVSPTDVLNLQSVGNVHVELETGVDDDAIYYNDVNEVICMENEICNKRISDAG